MSIAVLRPKPTCLLLVFVFQLPIACDSAPAKPAAVPAAANPEKQKRSDEDALAAFIEKDAKPAGSATQMPPGHPPISPTQEKPAAITGPSGSAESLALKFDAPNKWESQPLSSAMRKGHYKLPRAEGDSRDADVILFYFGPNQGGSVEMNLTRWKGMFVTEKGEPLPESATKVEHFEANGLKVTLLDVIGRYVESNMMTGQSGSATSEDFRMLAAVVETSTGPWFFKGVGPLKSMNEQEAAFRGMLKTTRE